MFWLFEGLDLPHAKERRLPDGSIELVIKLREDRFRVYDQQNHERLQSFRGCLIVGAHSEYTIIDTSCQTSIMGVHFKPGGAFPFLRLPASELQKMLGASTFRLLTSILSHIRLNSKGGNINGCQTNP
jgi:hypothetical protein